MLNQTCALWSIVTLTLPLPMHSFDGHDSFYNSPCDTQFGTSQAWHKGISSE